MKLQVKNELYMYYITKVKQYILIFISTPTLKKYHYDDPLTPFRMLLKKLDKGKSLMAVQLVLFAVTVLK